MLRMDEAVVETQEQKTIDVFPLSKLKRVLAFLADFFICFIVGLMAFHLMTNPIGKLITKADEQAENLIQAETKRDSTLYGNELLFYPDGSDKTPESISSNLEYTCKQYASSFLSNEVDSKYDVFHHFYVDIRGSVERWISACQGVDKNTSFFDFTSTSMTLKSVYVDEFSPLLDSKDEMSAKGKEDYQTFQEKYFLKAYSELVSDAESHDLIYKEVSYATQQQIVASILAQQQNLILVCSLISEFISLAVCFFLIPMASRYRKTLGMMAMRIQRVSLKDFRLVGKKDVFPYWVYQVALNFSPVFFLPLPILAFNELFVLTTPLFLAIASLVIDLVSLFFILIHSYNRSLLDVITGSMLISNDQLDEVYRAKGYEF